MKPSCPNYFYPLDIDRISRDVAARGIDIAPTRLRWERLASCLAAYCGEQGRDAFHRMAAVWPDYSRHDSELCYNRALRRTGRQVGIGYLKGVLKRHGIDTSQARYRSSGPIQIVKPTKKTKKTMKKINFNTLLHSLLNDRAALGRNQLIDLMLRLYPQQAVLMACQRYLIGFNSFNTGRLGDALIYWQVDDKRNIVNAKKIYYLFDGHRDKKIPPLVMYPDNPQCLFGLHLLTEADPDQPIAIVESEKSALIMSLAMPGYLWMACGSLNNFNENFLKPLKGRMIIGFPDVDIKRDKAKGVSVSCALWRDTAKQLRLKGWRIIIDANLEKTANSAQRLAKIDVADIALERARQESVKRLARPSARVYNANETNETNEKK